MLAVVLLLTGWVTPQILTVGRSLDFVPREPPPPAMSRFGILHATYMILELFKFGAGILVGVWILRLPRQTP